MDRLLLVCIGSALGGGARYLVALGAVRLLGAGFPFGTLLVNVTGSFLIAFINQVGLSSTLISPSTRIFLTIGIMGGLTTYSTFNYETLEMLRSGAFATATLNLGSTVMVCLVAGMLGLVAGRLVVPA